MTELIEEDEITPDISMPRTPPNHLEITPKYPKVDANNAGTHSMLTDEDVMLYSAMATNRQSYKSTSDTLYLIVRTYNKIHILLYGAEISVSLTRATHRQYSYDYVRTPAESTPSHRRNSWPL